jgi:hypothetical protein
MVMGESVADARQSMRGPSHGSVWAWGVEHECIDEPGRIWQAVMS